MAGGLDLEQEQVDGKSITKGSTSQKTLSFGHAQNSTTKEEKTQKVSPPLQKTCRDERLKKLENEINLVTNTNTDTSTSKESVHIMPPYGSIDEILEVDFSSIISRTSSLLHHFVLS